MTVTVYSKPSCGQCIATYRALDSKDISYRIVDLTKDEFAIETIKTLGYLSAPVVVVSDGDHWSGFQPDKIEELASRWA